MTTVKMSVDSLFWKGKRVYVTGHTGFKGSWLCLWLQSMGAEIKGYARESLTTPNLFAVAHVAKKMQHEIGDICNITQLTKSIVEFNPDILFHLAAQPLVRYSYQAPVETYQTNVMGTVHVLEAVRQCSNLKAVVNITTDKCYENKEWHWGYREDEAMGGFDPYSSSKGCSELITTAYRRSFLSDIGVGLASARAGNVIGGGDWSEDRLIPDILRAIEQNNPVIIRHPNSVRPWQHVLEPLSGYLMLAQALYSHPKKYAQGWNFGSSDEDAKPVSWIVDKMLKHWDGATWQLHPEANMQPHEAHYLKLDSSKAKAYLGWQSKLQLQQALEKVVLWHQKWLENQDMRMVCLQEIKSYQQQLTRSVDE